MRFRALAAACLLVARLDASSSAKPEDSGADAIVVSVGSAEIRQGELGFLLARMHEFERRSYGATPDEIRRAFVERRLVPELLVVEEAKRLHSPERPAVSDEIRAALAQALKEELERSFDAKLTRAELEAYCQSEGGQRPDASDARACGGDLSGHRVALRRQRATEETTRLTRELREKQVEHVDYALLERIDISALGTSAAATTGKSQSQP